MNSRSLSRGLRYALGGAVTAVLAACAINPPSAALDEARAAYAAVQRDPRIAALAPAEFLAAGDALHDAEAYWFAHSTQTQIAQAATIARQYAALALEAARLVEIERDVLAATAAREQLGRELRSQQLARAQAASAAHAERERAAEARLRQEEASRQAVQKAQVAQAAVDDAARAREQFQASVREARLEAVEAFSTQRGTVLVLTDDSFFTGRGQLSADAARTLQKIADLLKRYPGRQIAVEAFSSGAGSRQDQLLSEQRADAVREALLDAGLGMDRVSARGYGSAFPVAPVQTAEGRRLNRRIEIVVALGNGQILAR